MNDLVIEATTMTPRVQFEAVSGRLTIEGESYPESSNVFYEDIFNWLREYLDADKRAIEMHFKLNYFNTSSAKCILDILEMLEKYTKESGKVRVFWHYYEDDEDILQSGEEFAEDVSLDFTFVSQ